MNTQEAARSLRAYAEGYAGNIRGMCALAADLLESCVPRWISVEERLPENIAPGYEHDMSNAVLLYTPVDGYVHIGWYVRKKYNGRVVWHTLSAMRSYQTLTKKVTHWMPLPEPPKEDVKK